MRVLALIDMDSFYTQVEVKRDPSLRGEPVVVVQYNPYGDLRTLKPSDVRLFPDSNGSIIASSYEARKFGVKRNMMAQAAKKLCPDLKIVQVPVAHGKADLTIYREAGAHVINVLSSGAVCERASIDEAYLDVTAGAQQMLAAAAAAASGSGQGQQGQQQDSEQQQMDVDQLDLQAAAVGGSVLVALPKSVVGWHVAGMAPGAVGVADWWQQSGKSQDDQLLAAGAVIVARLRAAVAQQLGFSCSAGIAHSKILAKLGAGLNKPAQQTLVPAAAVSDLLDPLPISKLRALGGKFGEEIATSLGIQTVGELAAVSASRLEALVGEESAAWLARLAQGIDDLEVKPRTLPKSISCGKTFRGGNAITGLSAVHKWLQELGTELQERIEADRKDHQRLPTLLTVSIDTLPGAGGAAAGTGAAAAAAVASAVGQNAAAAVAANGGRHTAQTWRAGVVNVSRSCGLRRPVAEVMAEDALKLVKKWARDRGQGWKIIGMFINASNFVAAPTGASTLDRFMAAAGRQQQHQASSGPGSPMSPATAAGMTGTCGAVEGTGRAQASALATAAAGADASSMLGGGIGGAGATKRTAAVAGLDNSKGQPGGRGSSSRGGKRSYGDLRAYLGSSTAATAAPENRGGTAAWEEEHPAAEAPAAIPQQQPAELAQQEQEQHLQQQCDNCHPPAAAGIATAAAGMGNAGDAAGSNKVATPTLTAVSSPTGQARSVLSALSRLAPAAAATTTSEKQRQHVHAEQQQQQQQQQGDVGQQQVDGQRQQHQDQPNGQRSDVTSQVTELPQACMTPAAAPAGSELQSSLPSQAVVGSLNGWLGTPQQQPSQQLQQQQQEQGWPPAADTHSEFEFQMPHQQQQEELKDLQQQQQQQQQPPAAEDVQPIDGPDAQQTTDAGPVAPADGDSAPWQQPELRMSDIDPNVLAELPYHIQVEVRRAAGQRVGTAVTNSSSSRPGRGRGTKQQQPAGSIVKYFGKGR